MGAITMWLIGRLLALAQCDLLLLGHGEFQGHEISLFVGAIAKRLLCRVATLTPVIGAGLQFQNSRLFCGYVWF